MKPFFSLCLLIFCNTLIAQTPQVIWQKCYGGPNGEYAKNIWPTADGGYIVVGETEGGSGIIGYHGNIGIGDFWVIKLNSSGNAEWKKCLGGFHVETAGDVRQTADGGYIIAGSSGSAACNSTLVNGNLNFWAVKLSAKGDIEWEKKYGGSQVEYAWSVDIAPDGGYIIAGESESSDGDLTTNKGGRDIWVIKISNTGTLLWQKSMGGTNDECAYSVKATADGGCIMAGYTASNDGDIAGSKGNWDYCIIKLGAGGIVEWQKCLGGSMFETAWSVQLTPDGGYIINGMAGSADGDLTGNLTVNNPNYQDFWVVKLSQAGTIEWQKSYGGRYNDIGRYIQLTPDGGYILCGSSESPDGDAQCNSSSTIITDVLIIKISSSGAKEWVKSLGGDLYDDATCIQPVSDGNYILCGNTCSQSVSGYTPHVGFAGSCGDFWVVKLTPPPASVVLPTVTITPIRSKVCAGRTNIFFANPQYAGTGTGYSWQKNTLPVGNNSALYEAANLSNGDIITCTVTSGGECGISSLAGSGSLVVQFSNRILDPAITVTASTTIICPCSPVSFSTHVTNGGSSPVYQWLVNGVPNGETNPTFSSINLQPGDNVRCIFTDTSGCMLNGDVLTDPVAMTAPVVNPAAVSINASPISCPGAAITFIAVVTNGGRHPSYQWKVNGTTVGTDNDSLITSALNSGDIVNCTVTPDPLFTCTAAASVTSNSINVTFSSPTTPSVTIVSTGDTICRNSAATFTAQAVNAGASPLFQWKINGVTVPFTGQVFTPASLQNGDRVSCSVTADPSLPCSNNTPAGSNTVTMTVLDQQAPSVKISANVNPVCAGKAVTLKAAPENAGSNPGYQWFLNGTPLVEFSQEFSAAGLSNGDIVFCRCVPSPGACVDTIVESNYVTITVYDTPVLYVFPKDTTIKPGTQIQLFASGTDIGTYLWTPVDQLTNAQTLSPFSLPIYKTQGFSITATSSQGCSSTVNIFIRAGFPFDMPNAFTPDDNTINDIFRIPPGVIFDLREFSVFDRWGNKIFFTTDISKGWDGSYKGKKLNTGAFSYFITGFINGRQVSKKGTFVLIR